jgi:hypothetical protein
LNRINQTRLRHHEPRTTIAQNVFELKPSRSRVNWNHDSPKPAAAKDDLHKLHAIAAEQCYMVATFDTVGRKRSGSARGNGDGIVTGPGSSPVGEEGATSVPRHPGGEECRKGTNYRNCRPPKALLSICSINNCRFHKCLLCM